LNSPGKKRRPVDQEKRGGASKRENTATPLRKGEDTFSRGKNMYSQRQNWTKKRERTAPEAGKKKGAVAETGGKKKKKAKGGIASRSEGEKKKQGEKEAEK